MITSSPKPSRMAWVGWFAGAWALLTPLLVFLPIYKGQGDTTGTTAVDAGKFPEAIAVLAVVAACGLAGMIGLQMLAKGNSKGKWVTGTVAFLLLMLSAFTAKTTGPFIFPPGLLFTIPTLWMDVQRRR